MAKELKIWLDDEALVTAHLKDLGGQYAGESTSIHTYFNQPDGQVLKLVEAGGQATQDRLKKDGEQFVLVTKTPVDNKNQVLGELTGKYGVKRKLVMHAKSYVLEDYDVSLYDIEAVGQFLILTGDDPTVEMLHQWFGIDNPRIVTKSFDNL